MKLFLNAIILSSLLIMLMGCSGEISQPPTLPSQDSLPQAPPVATTDPVENPFGTGSIIVEPPPLWEHPRADMSPLADTQTDGDPSNILYAGILELERESGTITNSLDRDLMINMDITSLLMGAGCPGGCFRYRVNSIIDNVWDIDMTIENPTSIQVFDVRIIFRVLGNKKILNHDGYTDLFPLPGGSFINPFIAFAKDWMLRAFPMGPGATDTQNMQLYWPSGDPPIISYIITASMPGNTQEPYVIENFQQIGEFWWQGGECTLAVKVDDWQWDITSVRVDTRVFNNQIPFLVSNPEQPDRFEVRITNTNNAPPGTYPTLFRAQSPNPQNISMYNIFDVIVSGPPQNPPICELIINPDEIAVGQTTSLYPGPGTYDPDGNDIVLYEYDFFYNDGVFNTMAWNTDGSPITTPQAPYMGPNPVTITMAMRVTDNGAPPMTSEICTAQVIIISNQAPICDLKVEPDEIPSGGTTWLSPGPDCHDPDGNIVLYEYDFDYDGVNFNVDASNTDGSAVETTSYSNPGTDPISYTVALRVTDDGTPSMQSICTKEVTVVTNQTPICVLELSRYEINSGANIDCYPGEGTHDPDGEIILYEYDLDYDGVTFNVHRSNTSGAPVATGPIDNTTGQIIIRTIAMRVTDDGNPPASSICTRELTINPIQVAQNPWRNPAVRVTPTSLDYASIDRDRMQKNVVAYGNNVYVCYFGSIGGVEDLWIQRSTNGGVTFNAPQRFNVNTQCPHFNCPHANFISMDILANGWLAVATFGFPPNCSDQRVQPRFYPVRPNASGGVDIDNFIILNRASGRFYASAGEGVQCSNVAAHPTDPDVAWVDTLDLDGFGGNDPDDTSIWKITNITSSPTATIEYAVVDPVGNAPMESGTDKAHSYSVCDYNGNLHVTWCSRDLGALYYSMVYGNTPFPFDKTDYVQINLFGETYPEGSHITVDHDNNVYVSYAATGIPGEIEPQEIGLLKGVGYPPTFPDPPIILNHEREGNQVFPDIRVDHTNGDLWVAFTTFTHGPGQITFELYDANDGWTRFEPDYWINKDDPNHQWNNEHVHLFFQNTNRTAYAIWQNTDGPNAPHIYFNRTN